MDYVPLKNIYCTPGNHDLNRNIFKSQFDEHKEKILSFTDETKFNDFIKPEENIVLKKFEPFDREFYTGLYGYWTFADTANIALVIRTVKVGEDSICLYAGGGIVASSDPISEYEEAENKMLPLQDYFLQ